MAGRTLHDRPHGGQFAVRICRLYVGVMADMKILKRQPTYERRLDNGLTVIVREDHSAPVVAVVTHVKAGYFDEPDHLIGISHVLEHMYFKGTARRGVGEIARETKAAGGYLNAGTIYDHTSYYTVLPSSSLEQALDIQADALQRSAIDDEELRKELLVIIQEAKRKLDNPSAVAQETLYETMFDVHRIRRWRIGTEAVLRALTRAQVWDYYSNLYRATNTILVIAGAVDADLAFTLAERHYGGMPAGEPARDHAPAEPARRGFRYRELDGDIAQSSLQWGWRSPGTLHEDTAALDVLAVALGQGRASRLYREVRDAGAVAAISAYNYTPTSIGIFGISAELDPADTAAAVTHTARTMSAVLAHGFTNDEAARARNILEARMVRRLETVDGQANMIAAWQALGDWRRADEYLQRITRVDADELHHVARRYLDPDALTLLLYRPRTAACFAPDPAALRASLFTADVQHAAARAATVPAAAAVARTAPHVPRPQRPTHVEDGVHFYDLAEGGARVIVKPRTTAPLVSISFACRGGVISERVASAGMTGLMARTSVKGTRYRSGERLAEETEALGGSIAPGVGADLLDWSLSVPSRHLMRALDLLLEAALEPALDEEQAERERKITLSDLEHMRDDMYQYPMRLALSAAFRDHPYGFDITQLESAVRHADLSALHGWHDRHVLRGAPHIFVVGDIDEPDLVAAHIAARLADRVHDPLDIEAMPATWPESGRARIEERDKAQTALAFAFPGPPRNHPDVYALDLLSAAIAGLGGRLFEELRSRRSLAYAVSASALPRWLGGAFLAYIGTAPEREEEARATLLSELRRTTEVPLEEDELERARRYMIGAHQIRQQTHARQLADLAGAILLGAGLAELREHEQRLRAVTTEQVRAAAERWLVPDRVIEAVVRGNNNRSPENP
ncbi:MAG TPA: pitrilysin family protein [Longimicrobiales bacterium]|nr:pitrilysin family protein [Longimicrobiales bacterium]